MGSLSAPPLDLSAPAPKISTLPNIRSLLWGSRYTRVPPRYKGRSPYNIPISVDGCPWLSSPGVRPSAVEPEGFPFPTDPEGLGRPKGCELPSAPGRGPAEYREAASRVGYSRHGFYSREFFSPATWVFYGRRSTRRF